MRLRGSLNGNVPGLEVSVPREIADLAPGERPAPLVIKVTNRAPQQIQLMAVMLLTPSSQVSHR